MQTFIAPLATNYRIQCWGASGGVLPKEQTDGIGVDPGRGGYTSGNINLSKNIGLYVYIGESATLPSDTFYFNGGAMGEVPGGGATDIRLVGGEWNNFGSLKSRIMVAGGGGGGFYSLTTTNREPGHAGGLFGKNANCIYDNMEVSSFSGEGARQTRGGKYNRLKARSDCNYEHGDGIFGAGGYGRWTVYMDFNSSGGGGGYYGGAHGIHLGNGWSGGGGGSSFVSGYTGCDAIEESSTETNIIHTGQPNHYSGYVFTNPVMIDGGSTMPSPSGGIETGHSGNGYCIITWRQLPQ